VSRSLTLPAGWDPQALILMGRPAVDPRPRERMALDEVTVWR
jgi:hypothetical protein